MRHLSIIIAALIIATIATFSMGKQELAKDGRQTKIEGFAPDGSKDTALTVASQTIDMSDDIGWAAYSPSACKYRTMSTATVAGMQKTWVGGSWGSRVVNPNAPFVNFSGCTSGEVERH